MKLEYWIANPYCKNWNSASLLGPDDNVLVYKYKDQYRAFYEDCLIDVLDSPHEQLFSSGEIRPSVKYDLYIIAPKLMQVYYNGLYGRYITTIHSKIAHDVYADITSD